MTIACSCGAKLQVPSSARGKQVQCPKCSQKLMVGAAAGAATGAVAAAAAPAVSQQPAAAPAAESPFVDDPFVDPATAGQAMPAADDNPFASLPAMPASTAAAPADDMWSNLPSTPAAASAFPAATPGTQSLSPAAHPLNNDNAALAAAGGYSESLEDRLGKAAADSTKEPGEDFEIDKFHIALIAMIFIGPFMAYFSWQSKRHYDHLIAEGVKVDGLVTDGWERRGRRFRRSYYLVVEYQTSSGATVSDDFSVGSSLYNSVDLGETVPIAYAKDDPEDAVIVGGSDGSMFPVFLGIGIALFGIIGTTWVIYSNFLSARHA